MCLRTRKKSRFLPKLQTSRPEQEDVAATPTNFECDDCNFVTSAKKYLESHRCVQKTKLFLDNVCGSCGVHATSKAHLTNHKKMCGGGGMRTEIASAVGSITAVNSSSNDVQGWISQSSLLIVIEDFVKHDFLLIFVCPSKWPQGRQLRPISPRQRAEQ